MKRRHGIGTPILAALILVLGIKLFVADLALVEGSSMLPLLRPGEIVLVFRAAYGLRLPLGLGSAGYLFRWAEPRIGEIVVASSPRSGRAAVKRVASLEEFDSVFLLGDNPRESLDSREYGPVPVESILGKVLVFFPRARK